MGFGLRWEKVGNNFFYDLFKLFNWLLFCHAISQQSLFIIHSSFYEIVFYFSKEFSVFILFFPTSYELESKYVGKSYFSFFSFGTGISFPHKNLFNILYTTQVRQ